MIKICWQNKAPAGFKIRPESLPMNKNGNKGKGATLGGQMSERVSERVKRAVILRKKKRREHHREGSMGEKKETWKHVPKYARRHLKRTGVEMYGGELWDGRGSCGGEKPEVITPNLGGKQLRPDLQTWGTKKWLSRGAKRERPSGWGAKIARLCGWEMR